MRFPDGWWSKPALDSTDAKRGGTPGDGSLIRDAVTGGASGGGHVALRTWLLMTFLVAGLFPVAGSFIGWWRSVHARNDIQRVGQLQDACKLLLLRQIDHLMWLRKVGEFEGDPAVVRIDAVKDGHACAFGQWYYGDGAPEVLALVPEAASLWKELEAPHLQLHDSASELERLLQKGPEGRSEAIRYYRTRTCELSRLLLGRYRELRDALERAGVERER